MGGKAVTPQQADYWQIQPPPAAAPSDTGYWKISPPARPTPPSVTAPQSSPVPTVPSAPASATVPAAVPGANAPGQPPQNMYAVPGAVPGTPAPRAALPPTPPVMHEVPLIPQTPQERAASAPDTSENLFYKPLEAIQTHINEPIERFVGRNVQRAGETAERAIATAVTPTQPPAPGQEKTPQPVTEQEIAAARQQHPVAMGLAKGVAEAAGGLTDPRYLPFFMSGGEVAPILRELISLGTRGLMAKGAVDAATSLHNNWDKMTPEERVATATQGGITAYMAVHGAAKLRDAFSTDPKVAERNRLIDEARTIVNSAGMEFPYNPTPDDLKGNVRQFQARAANAPEADQPRMKAQVNRLQDIHDRLTQLGQTEQKPVVHASNDVEDLRASAERQAPKIGNALAEATKPVEGAKVEAIRDSKDTDRIEDKAARQGVAPSQIADIAAAKATVPNQAAAEEVLKNLHQTLPVVEANGTVTGLPGKNAVSQLQSVVKTGTPGEPVQHAEVILQTPEMHAATESTHDDYRKAQELRAAGKDAEAAALEQKIAGTHAEADQAARQRLEAEHAIQKPSTSGVLQHPQEEAGEPGRERGRVEPGEQGKDLAAARPEAPRQEKETGTYFGPQSVSSLPGAEDTSKYPALAGKGVAVPGVTDTGEAAKIAAEKTRQPGQPPIPPLSRENLKNQTLEVRDPEGNWKKGTVLADNISGGNNGVRRLRGVFEDGTKFDNVKIQDVRRPVSNERVPIQPAGVPASPVHQPDLAGAAANVPPPKAGESVQSAGGAAKPKWGVDFDGTLFKQNADGSIGEPLPERIQSVKELISKYGEQNVIIESRRAEHGPDEVKKMQDALASVGLPRLRVTADKEAETLFDNQAHHVETNANTPLPEVGKTAEVRQAEAKGSLTKPGLNRHAEALAQAREKLGIGPGQTPTDFKGLSKLMATADEIERGMREKPTEPKPLGNLVVKPIFGGKTETIPAEKVKGPAPAAPDLAAHLSEKIAGGDMPKDNPAPIPKGKEAVVIEQLMRKSALYASPSMADEAKGFAPKEAAPKKESLVKGESGSLDISKLNPKHIRQTYDKAVDELISGKLKIGDKYHEVAKHDETVANDLHLVDNAPRYFKAKADANLAKTTAGLTDDQIRLASMMVDSDSRDYLEAHKPEEYSAALGDPKVMEAVDRFKPLQEELTADRKALGWPVRKSLTIEENKDAAADEPKWNVVDRQGTVVDSFKSEGKAQRYIDQNAEDEPHLKRTYPEHSRSPLPAETGAGQAVGSFPHEKGLRPPKMDKKAREMSAEYNYEHGRKDFSGYVDSFKQTKTAMLKQKLFDDFTDNAEKWTAGTAQPSKIEYNGKTYYRPDVVQKAKEGGTDLPAYGVYDPTRGEKFMVFNPAEEWATLATGKPGIKATDRFLGPKTVVDAMENYDSTRGGESGKLRKFFQEQIVGLFGPMVHINNIVRHIGQATGLGTFDPRSWPSIARVLASSDLRGRVLKGVDDATIDMLSKYGAYTDWGDLANLNRYIGGNFNPANWIRTFGKGVLFDPKFAKGWGGLDPKARVVIADYFKDHYPDMSDADVARAVEDGFGNYNRANWTERQRLMAKFTLFPGWDQASVKWFLRHPFRVGVAGALVTLAINQALKALGKNKGDESTDLSYVHLGDRKFRSGLILDSMGDHLVSPILGALEAKMQHEDIGAGVASGGMRGSSALAGTLAGPIVEMVADQVYNRKYAGGGAELVKPEDKYTPGTWAPNAELEKRIAFAALKGSPALNRFIDPQGHWDWAQGLGGGVLGITNYKYGAEERFRQNLSKSYVYEQTLDQMAERDPEAAARFASEPIKSVYLMFHADLSQISRDLKDVDTQIERVRSSDLPSTERASALEDLKDNRNMLLKAADSLGDAINEAKAEAVKTK